jgi:hypothetical protein
MQQKFKTIFRRAGAVVFAAVLMASVAAFAAPEALAQQPEQDSSVKNAEPKTEELPFVGFASLSPEEQERALEGKSFAELYQAATMLTDEDARADLKALYNQMLRADYPDDEYLQALSDFVDVTYASPYEDEIKHAEVEQILDEALAMRPNSWRVKAGIANLLNRLPGRGYMQDGKFVYTPKRRPDLLSSQERARVRKLQLYAEALPLVREEIDRIGDGGRYPSRDVLKIQGEVQKYYLDFAKALLSVDSQDPKRLYARQQILTDLSVLPDYPPAKSYNSYFAYSYGVPVDQEGAPVFFSTSESFEAAKNDGERRQALLNELIERVPRYRYNEHFKRVYSSQEAVALLRAEEARQVFSVQTLEETSLFSSQNVGADQESRQEGAWALSTLADAETIAPLESGVKRFELPPEYDFVNLWRKLIEVEPFNRSTLQKNLAEEYQNRRQFDKAADLWKEFLKNENLSSVHERNAKAVLSQIVDPRVAIDSSSVVVGMKADLKVRYRNAVGAEVVVKRLNLAELLKIFRNNDFWQDYMALSFNIYDLNRLVETLLRCQLAPEEEMRENMPEDWNLKSEEREFYLDYSGGDFIGDEVARYSVEFEPDPNHYDKIARVDFPVGEPGAYLVEITATNGNKDAVVVWLRDVAIVRKPFEDGHRFFALDAQTGEPLVGKALEFAVYKRNGPVREYAKETDQYGSVLFSNDEIYKNFSSVVLVVVPEEGGDGGTATLFSFVDSLWSVGRRDDDAPQNARAFFISDRPVYRPNEKAEFKFIVGDAQYDAPEESEWAGRKVDCLIIAPDGKTVVKKRVKLDEYGAYSDSFEIPGDAELGAYDVRLIGQKIDDAKNADFLLGSGSFQLEDVDKQDFQVTIDAPKEPVMLGDAFKAKISVKNSVGAPVANAKVAYRAARRNYRAPSCLPSRPWDRFYGNGYWRFDYDCNWFPGWNEWGCGGAPSPNDPQRYGVPGFGAYGAVETDADGSVEITIDTSLVKALYPNEDQQYDIVAETVDESFQKRVGRARVYAAHRPFRTCVWFDRGFFQVGDTMNLGFQARRLDGKSVPGDAVVTLYKVEYEKTDDNSVKPIETEVFADKLKTDEEGGGTVAIPAANPGQYRVSCVVTSEDGIAQEGGQLIVVRGGASGTAGSKPVYRFSPLEIIPDKSEYSVGDVAQIQIASDNPDAYVLFTTNPRGGVTLGEPNIVKLENGLAYVGVPIEAADQSNFIVQGTTVFNGKTYSEQKELAVPPEQQFLKVAVEPSATRVKPGEKTTIQLRVADADGKPVAAQTAVAIYDKSLDYVPGRSSLRDIREFFWNRQGYAHLCAVDNLSKGTFINVFNFVCPISEQDRLQPVGIFDKELKRSAYSDSWLYEFGNDDEMTGAYHKGHKMIYYIGKLHTTAGPAVPTSGDGGHYSEAQYKSALPNRFQREESGAEKSASTLDVGSNPFFAPAYWAANLTPNADGVVEIEVVMPETSATWKIAAWSVGSGLCVGSGEAEIVTSDDVADAEKP